MFAKKVFPKFQVVKMKFCHFWPPCTNIVDLPLENLLFPLPWKKSFQHPFLGVDAHLSKCVTYECNLKFKAHIQTLSAINDIEFEFHLPLHFPFCC